MQIITDEEYMISMLGREPSWHSIEHENRYMPDRILKSGNATIVFWKDGTKTVVKLPEGDTPDDYSAFTAALAIKIFGSNSRVKKVIKTKTEIQKPKAKKGEKNETAPAGESTTGYQGL